MSSSNAEHEALGGEETPNPDPSACPYPEDETNPVSYFSNLV